MVNKIRIATNAAAPATGTYSQAVRTGDLVFVTGQTGRNPETGKLEPVAIRKITSSGLVSTLYRLPVPVPPYRLPMRDTNSLAVDDKGNVYVATGVISDFPSSEPGLIWSRSLIYKLSSAGTLSVVAGDESSKQIGTRFGPLPGSLDVPKAISYLGKRRFAVSQLIPTAEILAEGRGRSSLERVVMRPTRASRAAARARSTSRAALCGQHR